MLTIPDIIKTLYKRDGVWKSVYITGEGGILIRNPDVVRESFKFTESCCSDNVFRFGGCERSMVEFETVGIGNIRGKHIQVYFDISLASLSAAQIAALQADPGDGEVSSNINKAYQAITVYRIPLGTFFVTKCTRDHRQQTHRKVTACSPRYWRLSPIESAKLDWYAGGSVYNMDPETFLLANVGYWAPGFMESLGWTKTALSLPWDSPSWPAESFSKSAVYTDTGGSNHTIVMSGVRRQLAFSAGRQGLFSIHLGDLDAAGLYAFFLERFADVDWDATAVTTGLEPIRTPEDWIRYGMFPAVPALTKQDVTGELAQPMELQRAVLTGDVNVFATAGAARTQKPDKVSPLWSPNNWMLSIPDSVTVKIYDENSTLEYSFSTAMGADVPIVYQWTNASPDTRPTTVLTVPMTDEVTWNDGDNDWVFHRWSIDAEAVIKGWMEINGCMLTPGRSVPRIVQLSQASPVTLDPGDFEAFWWDEFDTDPVGTVTYTFGKEEAQVGSVGMGGGGSVYDLTGNAMLELIPDNRSGDIPDMISYRMAQGVSLLNAYAPSELSMPAWPWLEPGDALQYETADEEQVDTYIMQRTMDGIQILMDEIQAPGGDVEEEEK